MAAQNLPLQAPERRPEKSAPGRAYWPRPARKPSHFVIKIGGVIPC